MALAVLDEIADEIAARFGVDRLAIVHRSGEVPLGRRRRIAVVAVAAASRRGLRWPPATRSTRPRPGPRSGRRSGSRDGHVWIGQPARTGPSAEDGDDTEEEGS